MNNLIKDTKYKSYHFYEEVGLLLYNFKPSTVSMTPAEYEESVLELKEIVASTKPQLIIDYAINRLFIIDPQHQEWAVQQLVPVGIEVGVKKYAQVLATDLVSKLSGQQTVEEAHKIEGMFETQLFDKLEDALAWLDVSIKIEIPTK
jgi:hypothetical protein